MEKCDAKYEIRELFDHEYDTDIVNIYKASIIADNRKHTLKECNCSYLYIPVVRAGKDMLPFYYVHVCATTKVYNY